MLKIYKPKTPGQRHKKLINYKLESLSKNINFKKLILGVNNKSGRNSSGTITVRHRGGNSFRKKLRILDNYRSIKDIFWKVKSIEYNGYNKSRIAFIYNDVYNLGSYIKSPSLLKPNDIIGSFSDNFLNNQINIIKYTSQPGNVLPLKYIPVGVKIHAIQTVLNGKLWIANAPGTSASIVQQIQTKNMTVIKLPSSQYLTLSNSCTGTIGELSCELWKSSVLGKAGYNRKVGIRPTVRGIAMNPVDHPHGGRTNGGKISQTPWARPTKGYKTIRKLYKSKQRKLRFKLLS